jgi:hypothetical protein
MPARHDDGDGPLVADKPPGSVVRQCRLAAAIGQTEACPESACVFWDPGGAVLEGRCSFEQLELSGKPELAALLLETRSALEAAATATERRDTRRELYRMLNEEMDV